LAAHAARFHGDRLALIDGSFDTAGPQRYEVTGAGGAIQVERPFLPSPGQATVHIVSGGQHRTEAIAGGDQYALEADHFARSIRAGRLLPPAEDGLAQAAVIEALYQSAASGRAVRLAEG
jgi:predicted dehydrogenase